MLDIHQYVLKGRERFRSAKAWLLSRRTFLQTSFAEICALVFFLVGIIILVILFI